MLEYNLPAAPEGHRWMLRSGVSREYRYLHLEKPMWCGGHRTVHKDMVSNYTIESAGYESAVRQSARRVLSEIEVNFNLPVGEVR